MLLTLGAFWSSLLAILFVAVCLLMMLIILIQKPKGGGLSGAFGGGGGSAQSAFGAKTGDVLTWVTVMFFVAFLALAMGLTWVIHAERPVEQDMLQAPPTEGTMDSPASDVPADATTEAVPEGSDAGQRDDAGGEAEANGDVQGADVAAEGSATDAGEAGNPATDAASNTDEESGAGGDSEQTPAP